jgi:type VI secretion system protein ImpL
MMQNVFGSRLGKDVIRVCLYGVGLTSVASMIWLAGPLVTIGGYRPLESYVTREILILLIGAAVAGVAGTGFYRRKTGAEDIARGIGTDDNDQTVLNERMRDALATLKNAAGGKAAYLYDLPWYLLIGPPGSGKTTALVNSGLKFPLSRGATPAAIAGVGGTRYCDWWFTEEAVLIDTAGRYTTQDSDATADSKSWLGFLDLLKKGRPRQPINGVLVAISLEDLITLSPAEIAAHATAVRNRLLELHERFKVDFPVYALFTKSDLVAGFVEFFGHLDDPARRQVWGATFQTSDKTRNMVGEVPVEFDALIERLNSEMTDRLQDEPVPGTRVSLFGFPAQIAALKRPIFDFLNQIFEPTRYHAKATLRGFYFTSGTQQGTPIDQLIGALVKSFGAEEVAGAAYSGVGKSFFLTDLVRKVIIGEAGWVSTNRAAVRRARIVKAAAYGMLALVVLGLSAAWWTSYVLNRNLIAQTDAAVNQYRALAGPIARAAVVEDRALDKVLPLLHALRDLPAGYASREHPSSFAASFGLSQRERLQSSSENSYHVALERLFRPRLIYRLEEQLGANRDNTSFLYEALKVYLMIGGVQQEDRELIVAWMRRDWVDNLYPGAGNEAGRKELEEHLLAMLALDGAGEPLISLNGPLIEEAQQTLARMNVAQRAYELLKSQAMASSSSDWVAARHGGPDFPLVFDAVGGPQSLDNVRVPAFFTYAGFRRLFLDRLGGLAEQVKRDSWLLGAAGAQPAIALQYDTLGADLLEIYTRDFIDAWRQALGRLQMRPMTADRPKYVALAALGAATSPLKQLLESIRDETALTRERPEFAKNPGTKGAEDVPALLKQQGEAPGATIEAAFKPLHILLDGDGTKRPIDEIVGNLHEIDRNLTLLATDPTQASVVSAALPNNVVGLRADANRLPSPFADMLLKVAGSFEGDLTNSSHDQLARELGNQVTSTCEQIVANRYPFVRGSDREVPLADFGRLFGPNGAIDRFFTQNLAPLVDMSKGEWTWRQDSALARTLSPATLAEFHRAAQIRDTFFATGGTIPSIVLSVTPPVPVGSEAVKLEVNGSMVESKQAAAAGSPPVSAVATIQWPGAGSNRTAITVSQEAGGGSGLLSTQSSVQPSTLGRNGVWSLFRMVDAGSAVKRGDRVVATFFVGGRELQYQFGAGSLQNPLSLPALKDFHCPSRI